MELYFIENLEWMNVLSDMPNRQKKVRNILILIKSQFIVSQSFLKLYLLTGEI